MPAAHDPLSAIKALPALATPNGDRPPGAQELS